MKNIVNAYININECWTTDATVVANRSLLSYLYTKALMSNSDLSNLPSLVTNDYLRIARYYSCMKEANETQIDDLNTVLNGHGKINNQKLLSLPNTFRRFIAAGLDKQKNLEEDIARDKSAWKVLLKLIHAGTFNKYKKLQKVTLKTTFPNKKGICV